MLCEAPRRAELKLRVWLAWAQDRGLGGVARGACEDVRAALPRSGGWGAESSCGRTPSFTRVQELGEEFPASCWVESCSRLWGVQCKSGEPLPTLFVISCRACELLRS